MYEKEFENLFKSFEALREAQLSSDIQHAKAEAAITAVAEQQQAGENRISKLNTAMAELIEQHKKTEAAIAAAAEQQNKTDERLRKLGEMVGGMSNNDGAVAEEFFWNALKNRKELHGIQIDYSDKNIHRKKHGTEDEFDIVLWNGNSVIIVETKYKVHPNDLDKLKNRKIPNFRKLFVSRNEQKIYAAIAGFSIPDDLAEEAKNAGFFVLRQSGENLLIETGVLKAY